MKTQVLRFEQTHVGDVLKLPSGKYREVRISVEGNKYVRDCSAKDGDIVERVITKNLLVRLKRYLIG